MPPSSRTGGCWVSLWTISNRSEDQAKHRHQVFLHDWQDKLDPFLQFNDRDLLQGAGNISQQQAEYTRFAEQRRRLKEQEGEKDIKELLQWQPPKN